MLFVIIQTRLANSTISLLQMKLVKLVKVVKAARASPRVRDYAILVAGKMNTRCQSVKK